MARFRENYGQRPLHLIAAVASLAIAGYAILEILDRTAPLSFAIWFVGALIAHDLIAFPLYSMLGLIAGRVARSGGKHGGAALNYVRVPTVLSAFAFVVWFPLILGLSSEGFERATGNSTSPYLGRWLLLTAALFAISGLAFAVRSRRSA